MARFGGNDFTDFSVPLIFDGRYFIMEPGDPPRLTVVYEQEGLPIFEVLKNEPQANPLTDVSKTPPGIITVSDRQSGRFLYKIRPGSKTSIVFGALDGKELTVRITDRELRIGGHTLKNSKFIGELVGAAVTAEGQIRFGAPIPMLVRDWLSS